MTDLSQTSAFLMLIHVTALQPSSCAGTAEGQSAKRFWETAPLNLTPHISEDMPTPQTF